MAQIARMIGRPRAARVVGYALSAAPADVPCHRVVSRQGGLSEAFFALRPGRRTACYWRWKGVAFRPDGTVDLETCLWR